MSGVAKIYNRYGYLKIHKRYGTGAARRIRLKLTKNFPTKLYIQ